VEAEEKAFASLVSVYPEVNKKLKEFFVAVHGSDVGSHGKKRPHGLTRDNLLRREKENRFGFKLFMRTLTQVLAYHSNRSIGASTFSFESVNADTLNDQAPLLICPTFSMKQRTSWFIWPSCYAKNFTVMTFECCPRHPQVQVVGVGPNQRFEITRESKKIPSKEALEGCFWAEKEPFKNSEIRRIGGQ